MRDLIVADAELAREAQNISSAMRPLSPSVRTLSRDVLLQYENGALSNRAVMMALNNTSMQMANLAHSIASAVSPLVGDVDYSVYDTDSIDQLPRWETSMQATRADCLIGSGNKAR